MGTIENEINANKKTLVHRRNIIRLQERTGLDLSFCSQILKKNNGNYNKALLDLIRITKSRIKLAKSV